MRTLRIYFLDNFLMYHIAVLAILIMLYITFLVAFIYLTTRSLYILTSFLQFPFPLPLASSNHKSESHLFSYEFFGFCLFCLLVLFYIRYISEVMQCLSLINFPEDNASGSIHVVANGWISSFFMAE